MLLNGEMPLPRLPQVAILVPLLKIQTVKRLLTYIAHCAPHVDGAKRVASCSRYPVLQFSCYFMREFMLDAFVSLIIAKCGGSERTLEAFGFISRSLNGPIQGHVHLPVGLTLVRRPRCNRRLPIVPTRWVQHGTGFASADLHETTRGPS